MSTRTRHDVISVFSEIPIIASGLILGRVGFVTIVLIGQRRFYPK